MSDRADPRGPLSRRRRTTITGAAAAAAGGGGAATGRQATGSKVHDAGDKPRQHPTKSKTEDEVQGHAGDSRDVSRQHSPRKETSAAEDINERLSCHVLQESLLSSASGYSNYRGILNWCVVMLVSKMLV
ncbi:unnamed protein product [Pleuronectes platessa]|uniref:Uncharacterized protein n=1 Tax=Pleuronectes platessa TaxID=8262 RepID=A0A9N7YDD4_PLEPL|nr:unnamed protein product [Pleuronectes platessa]